MASNFSFKSNSRQIKNKITDLEIKSLREIGKMVTRDTKKRARKKTGKLRKSIKYRVRKKTKSVDIGIAKKAFYGSFYELGSSKTRKDPFLLPTVEEKRQEIQDIVSDVLRRL